MGSMEGEVRVGVREMGERERVLRARRRVAR